MWRAPHPRIIFGESRQVKSFRWIAASAIALAAAPVLAASMGPFGPQRLSDIDKFISSDAFEGRGPATRAETKTVDYIIQQFKAAGVQPGGDLVHGPDVTITTPAGPMRLTQGNEISVRAPLNGQSQVNLVNAPVVFVGYGVSASERNWDDF